jgi:hypothetical protein
LVWDHRHPIREDWSEKNVLENVGGRVSDDDDDDDDEVEGVGVSLSRRPESVATPTVAFVHPCLQSEKKKNYIHL